MQLFDNLTGIINDLESIIGKQNIRLSLGKLSKIIHLPTANIKILLLHG